MKPFHEWIADSANSIEDGSVIVNDTLNTPSTSTTINQENTDTLVIRTTISDNARVTGLPQVGSPGTIAPPSIGTTGSDTNISIDNISIVPTSGAATPTTITPVKQDMLDVITKNAANGIVPTKLQIRAAYADLEQIVNVNKSVLVSNWVDYFTGDSPLRDIIGDVLTDQYGATCLFDDEIDWWNKLYTGIRDGSIA